MHLHAVKYLVPQPETDVLSGVPVSHGHMQTNLCAL